MYGEYCLPRLVIAAPQGRSGKTTVTLGVVSAFIKRGLTVQPFKKGPDFIDPSWLTKITGRSCRNLDGFMMNREVILASFIGYARDADLSVVEGAMGLYDGVDLEGSGSTSELAKLIKAPVILVVDTTRMTRSVAAMVLGFKQFDQEVNIAGVILNKVARPRHEQMLRAAVEYYCGIPVLGIIPKGEKFNIPDRHLGLIPEAESKELSQIVQSAGKDVEKYFDLDKIIDLAGSAPLLSEKEADKALLGAIEAQRYKGTEAQRYKGTEAQRHKGTKGILIRKSNYTDNEHDKSEYNQRPLIGFFKDRAFTFYYPENLEALILAGARLVAIDSLNDQELLGIDALYIGGGFPEVFAGELESNVTLRETVARQIEEGMPVYAECGGLMYLGRQVAWQGKTYKMTGVLPFDVILENRPQGHGYTIVEVVRENPFFTKATIMKGHEFHHSRIINLDEQKVHFAFKVLRGYGINGQQDGLVYKNVLAAYAHLHTFSYPLWAPALVEKAKEFRSSLSE